VISLVPLNEARWGFNGFMGPLNVDQCTTPTFGNNVGTMIWHNLAHLLAFNFVNADNFLVIAKLNNLECVDFSISMCEMHGNCSRGQGPR